MLLIAGHAAGQTAALSLSSGSGAPGGVVTVALELASTGATLGGLEWTIGYSTKDITAVNVSATNEVACNNTAGTSTCVLLAINSNTIANGTVATIAFTISSSTTDTSSAIQFSKAIAVSSAGSAVPATAAGGTIVLTPPPVITSASTANATVGTSFTYQIAASNSPTSYGAAGLPAGLSLSTSTGLISGTPTASGTSSITISATNSGGTGSAALTLTVIAAAPSGGNPVANSSVPSAGSGPGERFSFTVSDQGGSGFITGVAILFAPTLNTTNACYLIWDRTANTVSLTYDNPANGQTPFTPGANGIATNEQCTMNAANSTVIMDSTQVVVTMDLTFNSTFYGAKNIYLYASEGTANSGWTAVGSWTVTGGASEANSVSPASGNGSTSTFTFTVSDSSSETNLTGMTMLFTAGAPSDTANACYLVYNRTTSTIGLWDNTGNTTLSTKGIGSSATLQNSQCAVGYTVMNVSGNSIQFQIQLVFSSANFAGTQSIYLDADEPDESSGLVYMGSWTIP